MLGERILKKKKMAFSGKPIERESLKNFRLREEVAWPRRGKHAGL